MTAFPNLTIPYGLRRILSVDVVQVRRGDMKLDRIPVIGRVRHVFEIPQETLSKANRTTYDTFVQAVRGRYGPVELTDPWDSVAYDCRLDEDTIRMLEDEPTRWGADTRLIEVANFKALKSAVAAFPTLSVTGAVVQLPYQMQRLYNTVIETNMDFTEKRYEDFGLAAGLQRWGAGGDELSDADAALILNTFEGNLGPLESMSLTEPETNTAYPAVHIVETEIIHELIEHNKNRVRLTLEQLP